MSKFLRVDFEKQPWGFVKVGGMEMNASLSVHEVGTFGVAIGDVVAVSHVWGDAQCEVENVQGASHQIKISRPEKMQRLLSIAESCGWQNLWLDNICINQEDDDEKSREVIKMGYVYKETRATVVLLDSTRSKLLDEMASTILCFQGCPNMPSIVERVTDDHWAMDVDKYLELGQDEWSKRLWTVQESALASRIYMAPVDKDKVYDVSGLKDCDVFWARLIVVASNLVLTGDWKPSDHLDPLGSLRLIWNLSNRWVAKANLTMCGALLYTSQVKCSVEKDRVYGILGLIPNVSITPAYGDTTLEEVVVTVMKECVNNLKQMDLLYIGGSKLEEMGKHMVPTWTSLKYPQKSTVGDIVHDGNCIYDENVGLMVSNPLVFQTKIVAVIEPRHLDLGHDDFQSLFKALKEKLDDDQMVDLIRGLMFVWEYPQYEDKDTATKFLNIWANAASLPPGRDRSDMLKREIGTDHEQHLRFQSVCGITRGDGPGSAYILSITKDNNCPCSCCKRTYISAIRYKALIEDNLVVVDYGGHIKNDMNDSRVPLIVAKPVQGGMKFISAIVQDRGILHESMDFQIDAITIV